MAYVWRRQVELICDAVSSRGALLSPEDAAGPPELPHWMPALESFTRQYRACPSPRTVMHADMLARYVQDPSAFHWDPRQMVMQPLQQQQQQRGPGGGFDPTVHEWWQLRDQADDMHKWGLYADSPVGCNFSLEVGIADPLDARITVGYLKSWDSMGVVRVTVTKGAPFEPGAHRRMVERGEFVLLDGANARDTAAAGGGAHVSQTHASHLCVRQQTPATERLQLELLPLCNDETVVLMSDRNAASKVTGGRKGYFVNFELLPIRPVFADQNAPTRHNRFKIEWVVSC
jgi:hypothetical protein